ETRPAQTARATRIDAIEALGEARNVLGRDPDASVAHAEVGAFVVDPPGELDFAARRRVLHRIRNQIGRDRMQLRFHAEQQSVALDVQPHYARTLLHRQHFLAQRRKYLTDVHRPLSL